VLAVLVVVACGPTVRPSATTTPTPTPPPAATPVPSSRPFVATAYPAAGAAPCGQAKAPDARHAPYAGNLKRITATNPTTVVFELCGPDVAFTSKIAAPAFAINDVAWLESHIDAGGAGDQDIVTDVNGTGPYRLEHWDRGSEISLARNDAYWGTPARNERLIVRWRDGSAQRLVELQGGTVDGIDEVASSAASAVNDDVSLQLEPRPGLDVFYVGLDNTVAPFGDERVRRAIAMGLDRAGIVQRFFPAGSEVASHFTPCAIPSGCAGTPWYEFDPLQAKELLAAAGFQGGFDTTIHYREAPRPDLPDPTAIANDLKTQLLDNLGIRAELVVEPEESFLTDLSAGAIDGIHLLGASVTYPDVTAFLDPRFGPGASKEFGKPFADIGKALAAGRATSNAGARNAAYAKANDLIRSHVPMIPVARAGSAAAFRADVEGAGASPLRLERFASMMPGDRRQLVWLTTAEPPGLYCADETDAIAALVCAQFADGLYAYDPAGTSVTPSLGRCAPNPELTVWTCALRGDVRFDDGATLDANDVVLSFAVQWDAEHPLHAGRDGEFSHFAAWFGGFLNPPSASP
jgi:peptide/nickel transport system substrate-binding protein